MWGAPPWIGSKAVYKFSDNFSSSLELKGVLYNSFTCHSPLSRIFCFVECKPNQDVEGLQSSHRDTVDAILDSMCKRSSFSGTSKTATEKRERRYSDTCLSIFVCLSKSIFEAYFSLALRVVRSKSQYSRKGSLFLFRIWRDYWAVDYIRWRLEWRSQRNN